MKIKPPLLYAIFVVLAVLSARPAEAQSQRFSYAGIVDEHTWVAVAIERGRASVFLCGDEETVAVDTQWFKGAAAVDGRWWRFESNGWIVWTRSWVEGTLGVVLRPGEDQARAWWAPAAEAGAGLYRDAMEYGVAGAVVLDEDGDGTLELQGALKLASTGVFIQVIPSITSTTVEPVDDRLIVLVPASDIGLDGTEAEAEAEPETETETETGTEIEAEADPVYVDIEIILLDPTTL